MQLGTIILSNGVGTDGKILIWRDVIICFKWYLPVRDYITFTSLLH